MTLRIMNSLRIFFFSFFLLGWVTIVFSQTSRPTVQEKKPWIDQHKQVIQTLQEEMTRIHSFLLKQKYPKTYYLRFRVQISRKVGVYAKNGSIYKIQNSKKEPQIKLHVQLRVGNHRFDQVGFDLYDEKIYQSVLPIGATIPMEMNASILKKYLWKMTDREYRIAVGTFWRKQYKHSLKAKKEDLAGDFSKEKAVRHWAPLQPSLAWNAEKWKKISKAITQQTASIPSVIESSAFIGGTEKIVLGIDSNGSVVRQRKLSYFWNLSMKYLSKEKEYLSSEESGAALQEKELPTAQKLNQVGDALWLRLIKTAKAKEGEVDEAPVLIDPILASALFFDGLVVQLESQRYLLKSTSKDYKDKLGEKILPSFISILDDPTQAYFGTTPLHAHYLLDDQWVPVKPLVMVQKGVLKNLYLSRKPFQKWNQSNGHGRASFGGSKIAFSRPGVVFIQSTRTYSEKKLLALLKSEVVQQGKRYGYVLKGLAGNSNASRGILSAEPADIFRLDVQTDKLERMKGLKINTSAKGLFNGILATGEQPNVFNGSDSFRSGTIPITVISPSLLIQKISFQKKRIDTKKGFDFPPPFAIQQRKKTQSSLLGHAEKQKAIQTLCQVFCGCPEQWFQSVSIPDCIRKTKSKNPTSLFQQICFRKGICSNYFLKMKKRK